MKQGTISILIGVHSPIHSILVLIAWIKLYKKFPRFWELCCIFLHDIGHVGKDYLTSIEEKRSHPILGARIAKVIFGQKGYDLIIDHDTNKENRLYKPDKCSWYIAPTMLLYWSTIVEPKLKKGETLRESVKNFRNQVKQSIETGQWTGNHQFYLRR